MGKHGLGWRGLLGVAQIAGTLGACQPNPVEVPDGPYDDYATGGAVNPGAGWSPAGDDGQPGACGRALISPRVVPLTLAQYAQALQDLLQPAAPAADEPDVASTDFELVDRPWVTTATLDRTLRMAEQAVAALPPEALPALLDCGSLNDRACVGAGLAHLATRAFSRPPAADEVQALLSIYDLGAAEVADGGRTGATTALTALLVAPSTLYRTEFTGGIGELSAFERASAIAALLLDSVPDPALLAAAETGALLTPAGLAQQLERLLALPRVQRHITDLVLSAYRVPRLFETPKDEMKFPQYTPALQASMYEETRRFVDDVLWTREAPVAELLASRQTFVDAPLAEIYGVSHPARSPAAFVPVTAPPDRAGLLTQPSVLSVLSRTDKTSVVARGLFVRGALLCLPKISSPPASVQAEVEAQLTADATEVELADYRAMTSPCSGCHQGFDRFGLLLEAYDPIGRSRPEHRGEPIDFAGLLPEAVAVSETAALVQYVLQEGRFVRCLSDRLLDYTLSITQGGDAGCATDPLHAQVAAGAGTMPEVLAAVLSHPAFATRKQEP